MVRPESCPVVLVSDVEKGESLASEVLSSEEGEVVNVEAWLVLAPVIRNVVKLDASVLAMLASSDGV